MFCITRCMVYLLGFILVAFMNRRYPIQCHLSTRAKENSISFLGCMRGYNSIVEKSMNSRNARKHECQLGHQLYSPSIHNFLRTRLVVTMLLVIGDATIEFMGREDGYALTRTVFSFQLNSIVNQNI